MAQEDALAKGTERVGQRHREALHTDHVCGGAAGVVPVDCRRSVQPW